ncbi:MAG: hypothetical protein J5517_00140 [Eubacterium sp.]|nr:hypothetical protein [Eubacterium sp.]
MKRSIKIMLTAGLLTALILIQSFGAGAVNAEEASTDNADVKCKIVKQDGEYRYYENDTFREDFTGLVKIDDEDTFELYYVENGKAITNSWKTVKDESGKFKYYFGKSGKAYKAESFAGMRSTRVEIKTVNKKKYGFDENGHMAKGLWATDTKLVYFNKNGVYNKKASKKYQKAVKTGKKSKSMPKKLKKLFGKPKKIKTTSSCNPFDLDPNEDMTNDVLNRYKGYTYIYKNISISLTKNKKTGVYYMDGAGPIDLE